MKIIQKFDIIFIDGLHEYDQVKKDIVNSLKFIDEKGFILIHDLLPEIGLKNMCQGYHRVVWRYGKFLWFVKNWEY